MLRALAAFGIATAVGALQWQHTANEIADAASQAEAVMQALLADATSDVTRQIHRGMRAPLDQNGYAQSLGNIAMTAFVTQYATSVNLTVLDPGSLQGFVMYYDGTCIKKAFKDLVEEFSNLYEPFCHGKWLTPSPSAVMLQTARNVSAKELDAITQRETMMYRAAAFDAANRTELDGNSSSALQRFIEQLVGALGGHIANPSYFHTFAENVVARLKESQQEGSTPLDELFELLYDESESKDGLVSLPAAESRVVNLVEKESDDLIKQLGRIPEDNIAAVAPLNESGYRKVANAKDTPMMAKFINRTAVSLGLKVKSPLNLFAFAPWYNNLCAFQTFEALKSELKSSVHRPAVCGGSWLDEPPQSVIATMAFKRMSHHRHRQAKKQ